MHVPIQPPGADPCDRPARNPGPPAAVRPRPGGTKPRPRAGSAGRSRPRGSHAPGSRPRGEFALWPGPRAFRISMGLAARWVGPHHGAAVGEAGPPGYARHPDYLVLRNSHPAHDPVLTGPAQSPFPLGLSEV